MDPGIGASSQVIVLPLERFSVNCLPINLLGKFCSVETSRISENFTSLSIPMLRMIIARIEMITTDNFFIYMSERLG